jgi:hypothetical protein
MPINYEETIAPDSTIQFDGDSSFIGLDNRQQPEQLPQGMVQVSQNMRLNQLQATVRKGMQKQTNSIAFVGAPLILPFTLGSSAVLRSSFTDGIFYSAIFSDPTTNLEWIMVATGTKTYMYSPGQAVTSQNYPTNETVKSTDAVDMFQAGGSMYMLRGLATATASVSSITRASTTATVTTSTAHGLSNGFWVKISGATQPEYNGNFQITVTGTTTFTYTVTGSPATPATGTILFAQLKLPLKWDGNQSHAWTTVSYGTISSPLIYMPTSGFGLIQSDRALLQYGRNTAIMSFIDNVEQYDTIYGEFNIALGQADYLVGFHPYQQAQTLVFNRHSIYVMNNTNGDVANVSVQEVTRQNGCSARRSIATCGSNVLFLSDRGVFILQPGLELLLRGASEPLSAPIDPTIRSINFSAVSGACAAYCNNRYYLAVPVNGSTRNNAMLVYNFINKNWESIDTFPNGFYCDFVVTTLLNNVQTLFCISKEGGIYAYEQLEYDEFGPANNNYPGFFTIDGVMRTRRFIFNTPALKRFNTVTTNFFLNANNSWSINAITVNPHTERYLPSISSVAANNITTPRIVGKRGYGLEIEYTNTNTTGAISNLTVSAYVQDRKLTSTP